MVSWARASLTRQVTLAAVVLAVVLGLVFAVLLNAINAQRSSAMDAQHGQQALASAARVERLVVDLQTGVRGFVITGDPSFLDPYRDARRVYPRASESLVVATNTDAGVERARFVAVRIDSYVNAYVEPLLDRARTSLAAARTVVAAGEGNERVEELRAALAAVGRSEREFLAASREEAEADADRAVVIGVAGFGVSGFLVVMFVLFIRRTIVDPTRRLANTAHLIADGDLSARTAGTEGDDEVAQMGRAFNSMAESLESAFSAAREAEAARDEFFALVSHELRTPLTSIVGYVELMNEDLEGAAPLTPEERMRFLEIINRNSRRLLRLVGDLLFVARLEAGRLDLERVELDLARPVRDSLEAAEARAARARVTLRGEAVDGIRVRGDEGRIGQAVDNLISNAIKFTPEGGSVTVRSAARNGEAVIEVADTGVGIPAAEQDRLFERFFRASTGSKVEGVGLGLAITLAIVEGHGGSIELESEPGQGSTFRLHLPLAS
jgi:signal transduction histidine kinase